MIRLLDLPWPGWVVTSDKEGVVQEISRDLAPQTVHEPIKIEDLLTPASRLLVLGAIMPEVLASGSSEDVILRLDAGRARQTPVLCSARLDPDGRRIRWLFMAAPRREQAERRLLALQRDAARRAREMEREANIDALTGLPNRRCFLSAFRTMDEALMGALALVDIDHFKSINDTYGHLTGDEVIKTTARLLSTCIRSDDLLARYGGEEFILWMPGANTPERAMLLGDRLRQAIEATEFGLEGRCVTISLGFCLLDGVAPDRLFDVIEQADQALYEAKRSGRNTVRLRRWHPGSSPRPVVGRDGETETDAG